MTFSTAQAEPLAVSTMAAAEPSKSRHLPTGDVGRRARSTDPVTSQEAAANAALFAGTHCERILAALEKLGSGTAQEIGKECGLTVVQCDRRLVELQRAGRALVLHGFDGKPLTRDGYRVWAGAAA